MRRRTVLVIAGLIALSAAAFAKDSGFAIGAEAASSENFNGWGGRFVFHIPRVPIYFGIGGFSDSNGFSVDATADYWFAHNQLSGMLDYYVGLGGYFALATGNQSEFALGARLPIGLQIWPLREGVLEIFLEVAPAWVPITNSAVSPLTFQLQPAIGFRIWF